MEEYEEYEVESSEEIEIGERLKRPVVPSFIMDKNSIAEHLDYIDTLLKSFDMMTWDDIRDKINQDDLTAKEFFERLKCKQTNTFLPTWNIDTFELARDFILSIPDRLSSKQKKVREELQALVLNNKDLTTYAIEADFYIKSRDDYIKMLEDELALAKRLTKDLELVEKSLLNNENFLAKLNDKMNTLHVNKKDMTILPREENKTQEQKRGERPKF